MIPEDSHQNLRREFLPKVIFISILFYLCRFVFIIKCWNINLKTHFLKFISSTYLIPKLCSLLYISYGFPIYIFKQKRILPILQPCSIQQLLCKNKSIPFSEVTYSSDINMCLWNRKSMYSLRQIVCIKLYQICSLPGLFFSFWTWCPYQKLPFPVSCPLGFFC